MREAVELNPWLDVLRQKAKLYDLPEKKLIKLAYDYFKGAVSELNEQQDLRCSAFG